MNINAHAVKRFGRRVEFSPNIQQALLALYDQSRKATAAECKLFDITQVCGSDYRIVTYQHVYAKRQTELVLIITDGEIKTVRTRYENRLWVNQDLNKNSHDLMRRV